MSKSTPHNGNRVYYFCYGANMAAETLKRRKVAPTLSEAAILRGWQFRMSYPGLPFLEPAFAGIHPSADPTVCCHGVVHEITREEMDNIVRTEGGGGVSPGLAPLPLLGVMEVRFGMTSRAWLTLTSLLAVL